MLKITVVRYVRQRNLVKSNKVPGRPAAYVFKMTLFYPEDEDSRFRRNVGRLLPSYTVPYLRRPQYWCVLPLLPRQNWDTSCVSCTTVLGQSAENSYTLCVTNLFHVDWWIGNMNRITVYFPLTVTDLESNVCNNFNHTLGSLSSPLCVWTWKIVCSQTQLCHMRCI